MSNLEPLRARFANFLGNEKFTEFVVVLNTFGRTKGRLRHWQESLWEKFTAVQSEYSGMSFAQVQQALRLCHIHDQELETPSPARVGQFSEYPYDLRSARRLFPCASGEWYCEACWAGFLEWESANRTLLHAFRPEFDRALLEPTDEDYECSAVFRERMRAGDEVWKIRSPESHWKRGGGMEFIALVRDGRIVTMVRSSFQ